MPVSNMHRQQRPNSDHAGGGRRLDWARWRWAMLAVLTTLVASSLIAFAAPGAHAETNRATLTWNTDNTDVDLHVWDANGAHAWFADPVGIPGASLSDDNTQGFGPETFTGVRSRAARPGHRRVLLLRRADDDGQSLGRRPRRRHAAVLHHAGLARAGGDHRLEPGRRGGVHAAGRLLRLRDGPAAAATDPHAHARRRPPRRLLPRPEPRPISSPRSPGSARAPRSARWTPSGRP